MITKITVNYPEVKSFNPNTDEAAYFVSVAKQILACARLVEYLRDFPDCNVLDAIKAYFDGTPIIRSGKGHAMYNISYLFIHELK